MAAPIQVGLDIGFSSIKIAVVETGSKPPKLLSLGHIAIPQPGIISEAQLDLDAVSNAIKSLVNEVKPPTTDVIIALPENKVFTRVIYDLPYLTDSELSQAIKYAAEEFVPMPINEVNLNYQVVFRSPTKDKNSRTVVFVVASPKTLIDKYINVLKNADLHPQAIETELISLSRSLVNPENFSPTTLIVQFGASVTDLAIVNEGLVLMTRSVATGSNALTRAIAQSFNFELVQAEEYKKVYGLLEDQLEGKLYQVIKPIMDIVLNEAKRMVQSYEFQNRQQTVKRVVLSGGGAKLPGLVSYFAGGLTLEAQEADTWSMLDIEPTFKNKILQEAPFYSVAVGLALRE
jgi:type IV pilus assembly protein PilM